MDGCIYRTIDGECDLYAKGGKYLAFCVLDMENCEGRKMSNADRIRAMMDEELANWIAYLHCPHYEDDDYACDDCKACWLEWLKQEATDG